MTTEAPGATPAPPGLRALVYAALPSTATPTNTLCQPLHRHVLDKAEGDVVELTRQKMSGQFGQDPHVVLTLRDGDLDPATDGDLWGLMTQTEGGVLVFGVSYVEDPEPVTESTESCPECGARNAFVVTREPGAGGPLRAGSALIECRECGTVWDS